MTDVASILSKARAAASVLATCTGQPKNVAFIACSYDTRFESLDMQLHEKVRQLTDAYGLEGPVRWSLWVVDDLPDTAWFGRNVQNAFNSAPDLRILESRLHVLKMSSCKPCPEGLKGQALLDGMAAALRAQPDLDAVIYINLNLKVNAVFSAPGLLQLLRGTCDAAIGSRACRDGGLAVSAGWAGRLKSRGFNLLVRTMLPQLAAYHDTNAPMKIFSPAAAWHLIRNARIPSVTMDCEWLLLLHNSSFCISCFPIVWEQRPGSRPPWHLSIKCLTEVYHVRKRHRIIAGAG